MGFAIIGFPTKRNGLRKMRDQLPSRLRNKSENKRFKEEEELRRAREREHRKKMEEERLQRERMKPPPVKTREQLRLEKRMEKLQKKKQQEMERLKAREEVKQRAEEKRRKLALIKERKADFKRRGIPKLGVIINEEMADIVSKAKFVPTAHIEKFEFEVLTEFWKKTPKQTALTNQHHRNKKQAHLSLITNEESVRENLATEREEPEIRKRSREQTDTVELEYSEGGEHSHKSKRHKKSKKDKKKKKKKDKKNKSSKRKHSEKSQSLNTEVNMTEDENNRDDVDTLIDPDFNIETVNPSENVTRSVSPSKRKQSPKESNLPSELSLSKLPPEVIQKIFIFSLANYNLLLTNKYLNHCLRLSDHLLKRNLYENYLFTIKKQDNENEEDGGDVTKRYLNVNLFKDPVMTKFFIKKFNSLTQLFDDFITDKVLESGIGTYKVPPLPHIIYVDYIHSFFDNPTFLKYIFQKFKIHVDILVDHVINWFFTQNHHKIEDFLHLMDNIKEYCQDFEYLKEKINFTAHHLVTILEYLFLQREDNPSNHIEFFQGISSIVDDFSTLSLMELKIKFVDIYLLTFYKFPSPEGETTDSDINTILDDSLLWSCLRKISNIELLDMFVARGVRPSYGEII